MSEVAYLCLVVLFVTCQQLVFLLLQSLQFVRMSLPQVPNIFQIDPPLMFELILQLANRLLQGGKPPTQMLILTRYGMVSSLSGLKFDIQSMNLCLLFGHLKPKSVLLGLELFLLTQ